MVILLIILTALLLHYLLFFVVVWIGLRKEKLDRSQENSTSSTGFEVSVIIAFRNEAHNLPKILDDIKKLENPGTPVEVIFVNDHSTDDWHKFRERMEDSPQIRFLEQKEGVSGKKRAIELGVANARGEIIFLTDADCRLPEKWITSLLKAFDEETGFVAGGVKYAESSRFFEKFQAYEFGGLMLCDAGLAAAGMPVVCSAASMAFRKGLFYEAEGYTSSIQLASGDDEFLMRAIHRLGYKVKFILNEEAIVTTSPNRDLKSFANQRGRWASKGLHYENKALIAFLFLIFLFYLSLILSPVFIYYFGMPVLLWFLIAMFLKTAIEYLVLRKGNGLLYGKLNPFLFPVMEVFQVPYIVFSAFKGLIGGFKWKEREYRR
ncbi:MAG: glycosyltransferase [Ignavibacteriales bacterium]|nr:hypothetical protein [Ignavibacteriaceae bacterium]MBW7872904.1 glycosyltransferase [Ignavibacteria bacterium]MBZ0196469.1 glycosyltransferase [Ignavibacteriaceae bacterium]MCZ2142467.1 glycosyltransferase [Ignavibacteriales bacterium]WKZ72866.1 MAG: glycosyltransferase [Ignavibacteriaceae bacterium]